MFNIQSNLFNQLITICINWILFFAIIWLILISIHDVILIPDLVFFFFLLIFHSLPLMHYFLHIKRVDYILNPLTHYWLKKTCFTELNMHESQMNHHKYE